MKRAIQASPNDSFKKPRFNNPQIGVAAFSIPPVVSPTQQQQQQNYDYASYYQPYGYYSSATIHQPLSQPPQQQAIMRPGGHYAYPHHQQQQQPYATGHMMGMNHAMQTMQQPYQQYPQPYNSLQQYSGAQHATAGYNMGYQHPPYSMQMSPSSHIPPIRTIYIGNLPLGATAENVLDQVRFGALESIRLLPEKSCAFVTFLDPSAAASFHASCQGANKLYVNGAEVRVGWGKPNTLPSNVQMAISSQNASRNVYIGSLHDNVTEQEIRQDVSEFGEIDNIKLVVKKAEDETSMAINSMTGTQSQRTMAFVHFCNIQAAIKCVATLPRDAKYIGHRVNFGKDRCAPKESKTTLHQLYGNHQQQSHHHQQSNGGTGAYMNGGYMGQSAFSFGPTQMPAAIISPGGTISGQTYPHTGASTVGYVANQFGYGGGTGFVDPTLATSGNLSFVPREIMHTVNSSNNRTVYLGGMPEDCIPEDICNVVRAGIIERVHIVAEKSCAFITFVDPAAAAIFYYLADQHGVLIRSKKVKPGWGKTVHPADRTVLAAVATGATRNVYIGLLNPQSTGVEAICRIFHKYGEIEVTNIVPDRKCGFVSFTDLRNAMKAVEGAQGDPEITQAGWKVSYGKDRCAGPIKLPRESHLAIGGNLPRRGTGTFGGMDERDEFRLKREMKLQEQQQRDGDGSLNLEQQEELAFVDGNDVPSVYPNEDHTMYDYTHDDGDDILVQEPLIDDSEAYELATEAFSEHHAEVIASTMSMRKRDTEENEVLVNETEDEDIGDEADKR